LLPQPTLVEVLELPALEPWWEAELPAELPAALLSAALLLE
jgi:hypothetical protein